MSRHQTPLPHVWLVTDARNDPGLERAIARLPRGSGVIFRHYHLAESARRARFRAIAGAARARGHLVILAATARTAKAWGADGAYGTAALLARGPALTRLVTAHSLRDLRQVRRADQIAAGGGGRHRR